MNGSIFHSTWPISLFGVRPLIRHALRRATLSVGEGDLPAGDSPAGAFPYLPLGEGGRLSGRKRGGTRSDPVPPHTRHACGVPPSPKERVCPLTRQGLWPCHPLLRRGFFQAIYASRSESFLTIREVMRNSTATKAKKPHWALVVSEVAMKS